MDGSIYDFGLQRTAFQPQVAAHPSPSPLPLSHDDPVEAVGSIGLITNPRSHRYRQSDGIARYPGLIAQTPRTREELRDVLAMFARRGIDLLVIDGGDGTVRDVLTCAGDWWGDSWPDIAILPRGKTNALATDLGIPARWSLDDAMAAKRRGRVAVRRPLQIGASSAPGVTVRGFLFGAGAFVNATALAQRTHRAGAFDGIAVGIALAWGVGQTMFGGDGNMWRTGSRIGLRYPEQAVRMHDSVPDGMAERYIMVASTLERFPLGLRPFGAPRAGMKTLVIDAPPHGLPGMVVPLLAGSQSIGLERRGYHRVDAPSVAIEIETRFILDGEGFPPGAYLLSEAAPLRFVVP